MALCATRKDIIAKDLYLRKGEKFLSPAPDHLRLKIYKY